MIIGAHKGRNPRLVGRRASEGSAALTHLIVLLHDRTGLSFDGISARLARDFGIDLSRAACWQRWKRGKEGQWETISDTEG